MTWFRGLAVVLIVCVIAITITTRASGQEITPEPLPTATPAYLQEVQLSSGNTLLVERRISYGEAAVVIVALVLWVTVILTQAVKIPREFMRR